jgi:hypothetical protein
MSQIQNIRTYIQEELSEKSTATLVNIIARFDFHQHAIPTVNELRQAVKDAKFLKATKECGNLVFIRTKSGSGIAPEEIQESDLETAYQLYLQKLK